MQLTRKAQTGETESSTWLLGDKPFTGTAFCTNVSWARGVFETLAEDVVHCWDSPAERPGHFAVEFVEGRIQ